MLVVVDADKRVPFDRLARRRCDQGPLAKVVEIDDGNRRSISFQICVPDRSGSEASSVPDLSRVRPV